MPGVLMLQTLVEAGAWLLRISEDFRHSVIVLREARNVKYGNFMEPGKSLVVTVEVTEASRTTPEVTFKGKGEMEGQSTVSAKFTRGPLQPARTATRPWRQTDERIVAAPSRGCTRCCAGELDRGMRPGDGSTSHAGPEVGRPHTEEWHACG